MAGYNEVAAQIMEHLCKCAKHGYTQGNRWGDGGTEVLEIDGRRYTIATGDRDCSSAIISAYQAAGVPVKDLGATYTGNMREAFLATGLFEWVPMSFVAQRGDVYLNEVNHTAMCVSVVPDMLAEFSIAENGGIYGKAGDQTGRESGIRGYYNYPWDGILHFKCGSAPKPETGPQRPSGGSTEVPKIMLRAQTADGTVHDWTSYPDFAGWRPCGPIVYLCVDCAWPIDVQAYAGGRWWPVLTNPNNMSDKDSGAVGCGDPITGLKMYLHSPNGDKVAAYQVAVSGGYYDVQRDTETTGGQDGYAGDLSSPIYEVKAHIADY